MPAKSKAQQQAAGTALAAKRGDKPKRELRGASKQMQHSMSEKELKELASTKQKGKPAHKSKT
ncbi:MULTISPECIES: DUF3008 family protein [Ochrobactrum]|uniref:DUF3008 family protein n=1 Tax=Ochrobactrum quorumnocens TaxID=271865 RepID=A0A5N1JNG3_9HYPH|nr:MULTISPECIES: DUF3008 family protein [Brucella/Ochrobactrum group]KAA9356149.1 DUF3008 family protein [[Ochrobactrum] quorumnocens]MBD7993245.1 DUF3008 family protein [Ochrobactrum gallinarum]MDH7793658.1 hypothetical protein [Ochrobactrum sp. AN78]